MPYPSRVMDSDELTAVFDDHVETVYLGEWRELVVGNVRLVRAADGEITVEAVEDVCEVI